MKLYFIFAVVLILTTNIFAQNKPISPKEYAAMLDKGMDVDWSKTGYRYQWNRNQRCLIQTA